MVQACMKIHCPVRVIYNAQITVHLRQSRWNIIYINTSVNDFEMIFEQKRYDELLSTFCNNMRKQRFDGQIANLKRFQGSQNKMKFK